RTRHVNRFAHLVFDVVLTPFEEIVIAFAPADDTVVIADGFQRRVESVVTSGACGRQNGFTKGHAIKPIVANDELLRPLRTTDQRIAKIARASQRPRNEVDFFRDRALGLGLTDEVADPCFCGTRVTYVGFQERAATEKIENIAAIWTLSEGHQVSLPPLILDHDQPVDAGFRTPNLARPAKQLTDRSTTLVAREALEGLGRRVESHDSIGDKIRGPNFVFVIDVDRVTPALTLGKAPDFPGLVHRVVATDFPGIPEAHPQQSFGIRPDTARPHTGFRRRHHQRIAAHGIDLGDVVARERGIPDLAVRRRCDSVSPRTFRCFPGLDLAARRIDAAVNTALPGEPKNAFAVEGRGIEVGAR